MDAQIRAREAFIERARKRIAHYDEVRAAGVSRLEESEAVGRVEGNATRTARSPARMQMLPRGGPSPADGDGIALQKQLGQHVLGNPPVVSPFRVRKREDYVPATEQEVMEWMTERNERSALVGEPFQSSAHVRVDHRGHPSCWSPIHGDQRGEESVPRRTVSRCGFRGTRVGEAPRRHRSPRS